MRRSVSVLAAIAALAACAPFPELDAYAADSGPPPQLLPMEEILAQAGTATADPGPAVAARAARLKARAATLSADPTAP